MGKVFTLIAILLAVFSIVQAQNAAAGLQITFEESFLAEANALVDTFLKFLIKYYQIPDIHGSFSVPFVGTYYYVIKNITIIDLQVKNSSTIIKHSPVRKQGYIVEKILGMMLKVEAVYEFAGAGSGTGATKLLIYQSVGFDLVPKEKNGHLTLASNECVVAIYMFDIRFYGSGSGTLNGFCHLFKGFIQDDVQDQIKSGIENGINVKANEALHNLPMRVTYGPVSVDLSLVADPEFDPNNQWFGFGLLFDVESASNPSLCPEGPQSLPSVVNNDMLQVFLGENVFNCLSIVLYNEGILTYTISASSVPEKYAKLLNTDFYQYLIPPLYSQYPNSNMSAEVYATQQPQVAFIKGGFFTNIVGQLDIYVLQPTNTQVLSLGVLVDSQMEVDVDNNVILAKLDALACNFTLIKSTIGDFEFEVFGEFLQAACATIVPPFINELFEKFAYPIPSYDGFSVVNPYIAYGDGYLGLSSSIIWQNITEVSEEGWTPETYF